MSDIVYHYTNQDAFMKIMTEGVLRCTDVLFMNDAKEFVHILDVIDAELKRRQSETSDLYDNALYDVLRSTVTISKKDDRAVHVCSFSYVFDDLSQWRAYAGTNPGYCIGFHRDRLVSFATEKNRRLRAGAIIYDDADKGREVKEVIDRFYDNYRKHSEHLKTSGQDFDLNRMRSHAMNLGDNLFYWGLEHAARFKDSGFHSEREFRLIIPEFASTGFESGRSFIRPYRVIEIGRENLKKILAVVWVGPGPHMALAKKSTKGFLASVGLGDVEVMESRLPYRSW